MAEDRLTQAVLRKRAEYRKVEKGYRFFEESYKGGADYINSDNLYIHTFEDGEGFRERKERAYFYNYCAPIVNAYNSFIYKIIFVRIPEIGKKHITRDGVAQS